MLSNLNCQILPPDLTILNVDDKINDIYLIKSGCIKVFSRNYYLLTQYNEGSFFGEY